MADQRIKYLKSKAEESLAKDNYLSAIDYYSQLYEFISSSCPESRFELRAVSDKIVKLLNAVAMKYIQQGKFCSHNRTLI